MEPPRFAADVMVGKLARWLRFLGHDTFYSNRAEDSYLKSLCRSEKRILLTRDRELCRQLGNPLSYRVENVHIQDQLTEVSLAFGLGRFDLPLRCSRCNGALLAIEKPRVENRVPPYVFLTQRVFSICGGCGKIYWQGTHLERIRGFAAMIQSGSGDRRT
jgi:uncharacterized protein with PIN domain